MGAIGRRQALRTLAVGGLGTAAIPAWFDRLAAVAEAHAQAPAAPAAAGWTPRVLDAHQDELVTVLSELVIPRTDTPGAKAALVNRFIDAVLEDSDEPDRRDFLKGLAWMDSRSRELFGTDFVKAAPAQQVALLTIVSSEKNTAHEDQVGVEFFEALKRMTVTGYYTSEIGMKELKDDGGLFFAEAGGCVHPEHGGVAPTPPPAGRRKKKG
jgi:hypothetical protein